MSYSVHVPWYATGFRGDKLEAALNEIAAIALRYGATHYAVYRSYDDRYKFLQISDFAHKHDWVAYWEGPEFIRFRALNSSWYQVPLLYAAQDLTAEGSLPGVVDVSDVEVA
jgi:hypothetical protein